MSNGPRETTTRERLRDYAVAIYGREGVSSACLYLQNSAKVDVNVLLFAAWVASKGVAISHSDIKVAGAVVGPWHADVVKSLRSVRQRLKQGPPPAPSKQTSQLRKQLQTLEIAAELIELDELESFAGQLKSRPILSARRLDAIIKALEFVVAESAGRRLTSDETAAVLQIAKSCEADSARGPDHI